MKLITHLPFEENREWREMTSRQLDRLPHVDPDDLPLDAVLVLFTFESTPGILDLQVAYLGDFGTYSVEMTGDFAKAVLYQYLSNERRLHPLVNELGHRVH